VFYDPKGFVQAHDTPRRERCLPESNGIDATNWSSAELEDGDNGYWLETVDMAAAFDAELGQYAWDDVEMVINMEQYLELRREANEALSKARNPRQVYAVTAALPPDLFEIEDKLLSSQTWFDGQPLSGSWYSIESKAESILKRFRYVRDRHSRTVKVFSRERPISPVLARKEGKILRAQTKEQLQALIGLGFTIYTQEDVAYAT
jgi:hypothetical protein